MESVIIDAIKSYQLEDRDIILLQPTSPFRTLKQIKKCMDLYLNAKCSLLISVTAADPVVLKYFVQEQGVKAISDEKYLFSNRQDLPKVFKPNGAFYIFKGSGINYNLVTSLNKWRNLNT